jgi:hypothetical protein
MNRIFIVSFAFILVTGTVRAQDDLVRQKALKIRDANNARQAGLQDPPAAPAAPTATPTPTAPATPQGINPAQQQLIDRLESDFAVVKTGAAATPTQKDAMLNEMTSLAKGATKPTKPSLTKLASDLATALAEKSLPPKDTALLAKDVNIIVNSGALTPSRAQTFATEAQNTLHKNGVSDANAQTVAADLKAVIDEIQKAKPKLYQ